MWKDEDEYIFTRTIIFWQLLKSLKSKIHKLYVYILLKEKKSFYYKMSYNSNHSVYNINAACQACPIFLSLIPATLRLLYLVLKML